MAYPLLLKAAYGGGGRGIRRVESEIEFVSLFETCLSEATAAFGEGGVFVEELIDQARHIEIQVGACACVFHPRARYSMLRC